MTLRDMAVSATMNVMRNVKRTAPMYPTCPTVHPTRKYKITPNMLTTFGANTPTNVFNEPRGFKDDDDDDAP